MRIDGWEAGSQYPNGHFVRSLGVAGEVETEVAALLIENSISVPPFSEAQVIYTKLSNSVLNPSIVFRPSVDLRPVQDILFVYNV